MKTVAFIFLLMIGLLSASCQKETQNDSDLEGEWYLTEYTPQAEFPEVTETYASGQITWTFNTRKQQVTVEIQEGVDFDVISEGKHRYEFGDNGCNHEDNLFIKVGDTGLGTLIRDHIADDSLVISDACVDGHILIFAR